MKLNVYNASITSRDIRPEKKHPGVAQKNTQKGVAKCQQTKGGPLDMQF